MLPDTVSPEVVSATADAAGAIVNLLLVWAIPMVALWIRTYTKVKIEEKHMKALHSAAATWAEDAILHGTTAATTNAMTGLRTYLEESVPDAMAVLKPRASTLIKIGGRHLAETLAAR